MVCVVKTTFFVLVNVDDVYTMPNLLDGITLILNLYKHKLTLMHNNKVIAELKNIRGNLIYPFVLFNMKGYYPIQINYKEGPAGQLHSISNSPRDYTC